MTDQHRPLPDAVVGAGPAGIACTLDLSREGLHVELLEASDGVGGRMRTDRRNGFLPGRGFQVLNTSCPQVKKRLDLRDLRLRPFTAGFVAGRYVCRDNRATGSVQGVLASGSRAAREAPAVRTAVRPVRV